MNEMQQLVKDLDYIVANETQYWDILSSKYIVPFLQRLDYQIQDSSQVLHEWKNQNSEGMRSLHELGCIFSKVRMKSKNNENVPNSFSIAALKAGRPNLIIANHNDKLFSVLSLYESIGLIPRTEHVLLCKETTTEEEVECLLLRTLLYVKVMDGINIKTPLYCLVWPEKLQARTLEKVVSLFQKLFLEPSRSQQAHLYLFAVVSSNHDNPLSYILREFGPIISELNSHPFDIYEALYSQKVNVLPTNVPGRPIYQVQLYESTKVGTGKTWKIQRDIRYLRKKTNKVQSVCIRLNSSDIDWEEIVETLWNYHPCQLSHASQETIVNVEKRVNDLNYSKDNWIVYHIDVSSCVNKDINDFFFQLLYLQHIDTMNYSFHVNPNMIFFIEIPSKIDSFSDTSHNFFYTLFFKMKFPVKLKPPPFNIGDKGQLSIKWMEEYFAGKLKQPSFVTGILRFFTQQTASSSRDINVENKINLNPTEISQFMRTYFPDLISLSLWHVTMFFNFLFTQFEVLANSRFLLNECIPFRHEATKCAIEFAQDLCFYSYNEEDTKKTYTSQFYLCEKWKKSKELLYLGCPAIAWEQEVSNTWNGQEKEKRMELLFRAVNVPEEKKKISDKNVIRFDTMC
ncbi:hypothetical protein RFI_19494 [Reticulomyxa filosa]|uniref:Uncharacterized protein n=1 Tax=Reticulomyxa filosa TaxID=46433 RepID=X6MW07_RETFI|nr:hypothetical protein RFI_19494 [Reticulomyxa filosa]|eukprot:ETO17816.1 hypothetical protein RFI_19494 [Reticulomyxa filosa]